MSGTVFLNNFDAGVIETFGARLFPRIVDGGSRNEYMLALDGVTGPPEYGGRLPVYFVSGKSRYNPKYLPALIIRRSEVAPAMQNGGQSWGIEYARPAPGAQTVNVDLPNGQTISGPNRLEIKPVATPFDLTYDITIRCRGPRAEKDAIAGLRHLLSVAEPPGCAVKVKDSLGDERGYDGLTQSIADVTEVLDLTARDAGWTLTLLIHGELDVIGPFEERSVTSIPVTSLTAME